MPKVTSKKTAQPKAKTKTIPYDLAAQLRTPEEMASYLDAWLEEAPDDAAGIARALGDIARAKGMAHVAREAGLSRESLYKALSTDGNPSFATILKVARALGYQTSRRSRLRLDVSDGEIKQLPTYPASPYILRRSAYPVSST